MSLRRLVLLRRSTSFSRSPVAPSGREGAEKGRNITALKTYSAATTTGEEAGENAKNDEEEEDKAFAEREKKFMLQRKLFRESLKMKNLERANGFTRKNLVLSASALGMSPAVVDAMMSDGDEVPPELKLLEQCVEDMDEKLKRDLSRSSSGESDGFPETAEEKLQRVIFERVFMMEKYAEWWPEAVLKAVRKGGPGYAKRMAGRRLEIAESIAEFAFSGEYADDDGDGDENYNGDSFSSSSDSDSNNASSRISGNATKVLKRADVAAIAGLLSLGETLVTVDFSRDRETTKKKLRLSIKAFVDARRQAQTVKDYAEAWTVVDAIVTNGANALDRLVDVASRNKKDDVFSFSKKKPSPRDALRVASKLFEKKQEFVSGLFKNKETKKEDENNNKNE
jgi:hypothetical protein